MTPSPNLNKKIGEMLERFDREFSALKFSETGDKIKAFIASEARKLVAGAFAAIKKDIIESEKEKADWMDKTDYAGSA